MIGYIKIVLMNAQLINIEKNSNGGRSKIERSNCKYCEKEIVTY